MQPDRRQLGSVGWSAAWTMPIRYTTKELEMTEAYYPFPFPYPNIFYFYLYELRMDIIRDGEMVWAPDLVNSQGGDVLLIWSVGKRRVKKWNVDVPLLPLSSSCVRSASLPLPQCEPLTGWATPACTGRRRVLPHPLRCSRCRDRGARCCGAAGGPSFQSFCRPAPLSGHRSRDGPGATRGWLSSADDGGGALIDDERGWVTAPPLLWGLRRRSDEATPVLSFQNTSLSAFPSIL